VTLPERAVDVNGLGGTPISLDGMTSNARIRQKLSAKSLHPPVSGCRRFRRRGGFPGSHSTFEIPHFRIPVFRSVSVYSLL